MNKIKNKILFFTVLVVLLFPLKSVFSATNTDKTFGYGLVQCDGVLNPNEPHRQQKCNFAYLVNSINYIIYRMIAISIPLATALFAYAGFLYISGEQDKIKQAKNIFINVAIGFIIMITAWFVVVTVVNWVVDSKTGATSLIK
jgi:hypothetical protein